MVYAPHSKITLSGTIGNGVTNLETWSCNFCFDVGPFVLQSSVNAVRDAAQTLIAGTADRFSRRVQLREVKYSSIDAAGKLIGNSIVAPANAQGSNATVIFPPQITLVASLMTGERGGSKRGRVYLPMPAVPMDDATFEIGTGARDDVEAGVVAFVNAAHSALGGTGLIVASRKGYNTKVTSIRVGRVLDTMRSRRRSLPEFYDAGTALA